MVKSLMLALCLVLPLQVQATTTTVTLNPGDTLTVTVPNGVTPPPVVTPPNPGTPVGTQIIWSTTTNSPRVFTTGVKQGSVKNFWFKTPLTMPTKNHNLLIGPAYSGFEDAGKEAVMRDQAGNLVSTQKGPTSAQFLMQFDKVIQPSFGFNPAIQLKPDTVYQVQVTVPSCRTDCSYYVDNLITSVSSAP